MKLEMQYRSSACRILDAYMSLHIWQRDYRKNRTYFIQGSC